MQKVVKQKDDLGLIERIGGSRNRGQRRIASTSLVNKSLVFGRESEKDFIINKLLFGEEESCEGGVRVIPIVGMGGLGKTTLAQLVYNDDRVKTFFKLRAWVCVSEEFDIVRVMKTLLESLTSMASDKNDLNELQVEVKKKLSKNRFLIVLDDVWNENYNDWMALRSPFEAGSPESKIIVTTRNQQVASMMGTVSAYHLKEMSLEDKVNSNGQYNVSERVRHSSFIRQKYDVFRKFEPFYKTKCLRTFLALPVFVPDLAVECYLTNKVFQDLLAKLGCLRVLSLTGYCISELPDCIGDLSHLRYLNLSRTKIRYLPESLCALCNLQTLDLSHCKKLTKLPQGMGNLISLHYLNIVRTDNMTEMPLHIGKLINLKKLSKFIVAKGNGRRITELKGLSHLQGQLSLFDLQNVAEIRDVRVANLKEKRGLDDLIMKWSSAPNDTRSEVDEFEVLDMLEPHQNLKKLSIFFYEGSKFPSWIGNPSFVNMVYLNLCDCSKITSLPSLGRLPLLKDLHIERMSGRNVEVGEMFQPLEFEAAEKVFPYLHQLVLQSCPKLVGDLPNLLTSLIKLSIFECPMLTAPTLSLPSLRELNLEQCDERFLTRLKDLTALTRLKIENISNLSCLPQDFTCLVSLQVTEVEDCGGLRSLWQEGAGLENLSCLKRLAVIKCPQLLQSIDEDEELPSSLEYIEIKDCSNLSLPKGVVHDGSSSITRCHLKQLEIVGCPSLLFPSGELPAALKRLEIWDCDWLDYIPERLLLNSRSLEFIRIGNCKNLRALPHCLSTFEHLTELHVNQCSSLEYFPESGLPIHNLRALLIFECENLKSLPNQMHDLTTLQHLTVFGCPCIETFPEGDFPPNLLSLTILGCKQLKLRCAMWHLHKLTSLKDLIVGDFDRDMVSFPEDFTIPPNLVHLQIQRLPKLKSISEGLLDLISLEALDVWNCPNLQCLPEKGLPITLGVLHIRNCPLLEEECRNEKGAYWPIISNLPRIAGLIIFDPKEMAAVLLRRSYAKWCLLM
ncbi:hypothetical protein Goklo_014323 [Gossypium klotzschianum]|uniref:NB-ARC domain-containing protein n=1 Tax=Gossypium klotzschianum TaxID=34286 RepID=A0A7J8U7H9_9ROSI|nr:hypothetical protein [Gossypium klotzschianum]